MIRLIMWIGMLGFGIVGSAQQQVSFKECSDKAGTQSELDRCAHDDAALADSELNTAYKSLLSKIAGNSSAIEKLKESERAWLRYRDAYIKAVYPAEDKQLVYGTVYPMNVNLLRAKITREHLSALAHILDEYEPPQ